MMATYKTLDDVVSYEIADALGDFVFDFDVWAIARECYRYDEEAGEFVYVLDEDDDDAFWEIARRHEADTWWWSADVTCDGLPIIIETKTSASEGLEDAFDSWVSCHYGSWNYSRNLHREHEEIARSIQCLKTLYATRDDDGDWSFEIR